MALLPSSHVSSPKLAVTPTMLTALAIVKRRATTAAASMLSVPCLVVGPVATVVTVPTA